MKRIHLITWGVLFVSMLFVQNIQAQYKLRFHVTYFDGTDYQVSIGSFRMYDTSDGTARIRRSFSTDIDIGRGRTYDIELDVDPRDYRWTYLNIDQYCPFGPCYDRPTGPLPIYSGPNVCGQTVVEKVFYYRIEIEYSRPQSAPRLMGGGLLDNICSESVTIETAERATDETYTWEVSRSVSGPWSAFATTTGANVNRTTINRALLNAALNDGQGGNTFQVRVRASGCWSWAERISPPTLTVFQSGVPSALTTVVTPPSCRGGDNGNIEITALRNADGSLFQPTGALTYSLTSPLNAIYNFTSNANSGIQINAAMGIPVTAGTWRIDVQGVGLTCTMNTHVTVSEPLLMTFQSSGVSQPILCAGGTGAVSATINNGSSPYTYTLTRTDNPGFQEIITSNLGSHTFSSLLPGTYSIRVNSCNQIINTSAIYLGGATDPIAIVSLTGSNVSCAGQTNGQLMVTASGGTLPYAVQVDGGSFVNLSGSSYTGTGLSAGIHQVNVRDARGCVVSRDLSIQTNASIGGEVQDLQSVTCAGGNNGLLVLTGRGSAGVVFEYSLNGGAYQTINGFAGLTAGVYPVSIRDRNSVSCRWDSSVVITEPLPIQINEFTVTSAITCQGESNGSLRALASGGTPQFGYTYRLLETGSLDMTSRTSSGAVMFNQLSAGHYQLTVSDGTVNCSVTSDLVLNEPTAVFFHAVMSDYNGSAVSCAGSSDGSVSIHAAGGIYPHRISVSGRVDQVISSSGESAVFQNFQSGDYFFTITSNGGLCQNDTLIRLQAPASLAMGLSSRTYGDGYQVSCQGSSDGIVSAKSSGGTKPYSYVISPSGTPLSHVSVLLDSVGFTNLSAGHYSVQLTDVNNCSITEDIELSEPDELEVASIEKPDIFGRQLTCHGDQDAEVRVYTRGGSYPHRLVLHHTIQEGNTNSTGEGVLFTGLGAGAYTFSIEDGEGCISEGNFELTAPDAVALDNGQTMIVQPDCAGEQTGMLHVEALGGIGTNYRYDLRYLGDRSRLPFPYAEHQLGTGNPVDFDLLVAGSYVLSVTDEVGCLYTEAITLTTHSQVTASISTTGITCKHDTDGTASIAIAGGVAPYALLWNYQDQPIQSSDNMEEHATSSISNLKEGLYTFEISDANGCAYYTGNYAFQIEGPAEALVLHATVKQVTCQGDDNGMIILQAQGGWQESAYRYGTNPVLLNSNGLIYEELSPGSYTYYAMDNRGCIDTLETVITEPQTLSAMISETRNVSCQGLSDGGFELNVEGGSIPYQVSLDNGLSWVEGNGFEALNAGSYNTTVRDAQGCVTQQWVQITEPEALKAEITAQTNTLCEEFNGSVTVAITGGTPDYVYSWINKEQVEVGNSLTVSNLKAGPYSFKVVDDQYCKHELMVNIINTNDIVFEVINVKPVSCYGESDGSAALSVTTIQAPYTVLWDNGATSLSTADLRAGDNTVVLQDANRCQVSTTFVVPGPEALELNHVQSTSPSCYGICDGTLSVQALGGNGGYSYSWMEQSSLSSTISNACAGDYTVTVRDAKNCLLEKRMTLNGPAAPKLGMEDTTYYICQGQKVNITLSDWYSLNWSSDNGFNSTLPAVTLTQEGVYHVSGSDARGCLAAADFNVIYSADLLKSEFLVPRETYIGDTIVCVNLSLPQPDSWTWTFDQNRIVSLGHDHAYQQLVFLEAGEYTLTLVSKLGGCVAEQSKTVLVLKDKPGDNERFYLGYEEKGLKEVVVFPNPNDGHFTCEVVMHKKGTVYLKVVDLYGQLLTAYEGEEPEEFSVDLSIGNQPAGLYWMIVETGDDRKIVKVLVKK